MEPRGADVVIVGGGVIGLSAAWELTKAGVEVVVLERGAAPPLAALVTGPGGQATGAAAGMLAPLAEAKRGPAELDPGPLLKMGLASLRAYPGFVDALREETGLDPELAGPGMLRVARDAAEQEELLAAHAWQRNLGLPLEFLDGESARQLEPALAPGVVGAILSIQERHVEPRRLARALALSAVRRGVRIVESAAVTGFESKGARVVAVESQAGRFPCGQLLMASGAWSGGIARGLGVTLPVFPVRGQVLALAPLPPPVRHSIYSRAGYLVPKADGRLVVGATEEHAGFAAYPTLGGMSRLLETARDLVPSLAEAPFESVWAGLRPGSADGLPILGTLPGWENVHVATGHYRNGILLAPVTGQLVAEALTQGSWPAAAAPFSPARFPTA